MYSDIAQEISSVAGLSAEQISEVVCILDNYLAELEQGGRPEPKALLARHPEHARVLAIYLEKLELLHAAGAGLRGKSWPPAPGAAGPASRPSRLGDYRILREVGRGGMGMVYEAVQESLGRRVALKVLPSAAALDPRQLQRFKNEAQAAAHLHHPNIVPVFGVGDDDGVHYYAMQFIDGQTLAALIQEMRRQTGPASAGPATYVPAPAAPGPRSRPEPRDSVTADYLSRQPSPAPAAENVLDRAEAFLAARPTPWAAYFRTLAQIGIQAALALEHAHQLGVVHRDIKPANLLVDGRGTVWVTDFGLAQFRDRAELTQSGDLVGTLRYMSPEQALAKRGLVDQRTDIYSLGLTLYEAATLEPAFTGRDREELLRQIAFEEPLPPRRVNPAIPADLETILLKATDKEPAARYVTAQELAEDLRRFLADEPIRARRPTLVQRVVKAGRRHRAVLTATILVALLGLAASTLLSWWGQLQKERERAQTALQRERAREAADALYAQLRKWLAQEPGVEDYQRESLETALHFYEGFAGESGPGVQARYKRVEAARRVAEINLWLSRWPPDKTAQHLRAAEHATQQATDLLEGLAADYPGDPRYPEELADCRLTLATVLQKTGRFAPAAQAAAAARVFFAKLVADCPRRADYREKLGLCYALLGSIATAEPGGYGPAEEAYRQAETLFQRLANDYPRQADYAHDLADVSVEHGRLLQAFGRPGEAEPIFRQAIALLKRSQDDPRSPPDLRHELGLAYFNLGNVIENLREVEAAQGFRQTLAGGALPEARAQLGMAWCAGGVEMVQTIRLLEAERIYGEGRRLYEKLVDASPQVPRYQAHLGLTLDRLAVLRSRRGDWRGAHELAVRAVRHQRAAFRASPGNYGLALQRQYDHLGNILVALGEHEQAARAAGELARVISRCPIGESKAMDLLARCAPVADHDPRLSPRERRQRAAAYRDQAAVLAREAAQNCAGIPDVENNVAWFLVACPDGRYRDPKLAVTLAKQAVGADPRNWMYWNTLGLASYRQGDCKAAVQALRQAIELDRGTESLDWFILAMAQWGAGERQQARASFAQALRSKSTATEEEVRRFRAEAATLLGLPTRPGPSEAYPPRADAGRGRAAPPGGAG